MTLPWKINNHEILCTFVFFGLVCINYELLKDILYLIYRNSITNIFTELFFQISIVGFDSQEKFELLLPFTKIMLIHTQMLIYDTLEQFNDNSFLIKVAEILNFS